MLLIVVLLMLAVRPWTTIIHRIRLREPVLPFRPRHTITWGLMDIVMAMALLTLGALLSREVVGSYIELPEDPRDYTTEVTIWLLGAQSLATLAASAISVIFIGFRNGFDWERVGWDRKTIRQDLKIGGWAFLALAGPTLTIQFLMVTVGGMASEHPLIEAINQNLVLFPICAFSAAIVAPICEEFLFRVLFQGWMQKITWENVDSQRMLFGESRGERTKVAEPAGDWRDQETEDRSNSSDHGAADSRSAVPQTESSSLRKGDYRVAVLPIVISALVFGLMHYSHGPDWIALFFLALGLGYVYQRTNRILPCIVIHFLLNTLSLLGLLLSRFLPAN